MVPFQNRKTAKNWRPYWIFGHKMSQKQIFLNCYIKSVELQMNAPFVTFQCHHLKVFRIVYLQANCDFKKIITQARKNIFSCGFLHLVHLNEIFKNKLINSSTKMVPFQKMAKIGRQKSTIWAFFI